MSNLTVAQTPTMSSRELADLLDKEHKNIKRDIKALLYVLEIDALRFERNYLDGNNRTQTEYALPRRECEILITGYDIKRRAAVIDRWYALESKALTPSPKTLMVSRAEELVCLREMGIFDNDEVVAILSEEFPILKPRTAPVLTYNSEMQCPVVRFLNERMTMRAGLNITSHDLFWAINDHYDFFTSQAKITRIVKLLHLEGVEYGQIRTKDKGYQRGFKGLGLL